MNKSTLKKSRGLNLRSVLWVVPLGLLPYGSNASIVDFDDPKTITNGYTVTSNNDAFITKVTVDFTNTKGVVLAMDVNPAPPALPAPRDEFFSFRLLNNTGKAINNLWVQFVKPASQTFNNIPHRFWWANSVHDTTFDLEVDWNSVEIVGTGSAVSVNLPFLESGKWHKGDFLNMTLPWDYFNYPTKTDWLLVIDPEEPDFSDLAFDTDVVVQTPIPAAGWLFASGIFGCWGLSRKRKYRRTVVC